MQGRRLQSYSTSPRTDVAIFCGDSFCAFVGGDGKKISVLHLPRNGQKSTENELLTLSGHHKIIASLTIHPVRRELCSAASDYIISWDIDNAYAHHSSVLKNMNISAYSGWIVTLKVDLESVDHHPCESHQIIGCGLPSLQSIYNGRLVKKAKSIIRDANHPANAYFELLPSGRRYRTFRGSQIRGKVISSGLGEVSFLSYSYHGYRVAVCAETSVHVLDTKDASTECVLEGHDGRVTCAEFSPHYLQVLITAAEDRTFKVWDLEERCVLYKSCIVSSSPFVSLAMRTSQPVFALGTLDGMVRVYDVNGETGYRMLHQVDLTKVRTAPEAALNDSTSGESQGPPVISSRPRWQQPRDRDLDLDNDTEVGCPILTIAFVEGGDEKLVEPETEIFVPEEERVEPTSKSLMLVATSCGIVGIDMKTLQSQSLANFMETLPNDDKPINTIGSCTFSTDSKNQVHCMVSSLFEPKVHLLSLEQTDQTTSTNRVITVLSNAPLHPQSPLRAELRPKQTERKTSKSSINYKPANIAGTLDKKGRIADKQPIVNRPKVRSSGYGSEPPRATMFKPQTNVSKSKPTAAATKRSSVDCGDRRTSYPTDGPAPTELKLKIHVDTKPVPINSIQFRGDGQCLCCCLSNSTAHVYKLPLNADRVASLVGHSTAVSKCHWSQDLQYVMTSSEQCACVHALSQKEPVMVVDRLRDNFDIDKETGYSKDNPTFSKPVRHAQFYYMDKFLLLTTGGALNLYKYHIDPTKSDLKRYVTKSRYKLVTSLALSNAHNITAMSAVNAFYSYLVLCAGSDKSVELFDMNECRVVRTMTDCHVRPVHTLVQGSGNNGGGIVNHDTFVTSAAGDGIKLWDIRGDRCCGRYEGHSSRALPCGLDSSPCGRYIATGAEDKSAYVYDVRQSSYLHKLTGHTDTVADVAFHPRLPQLYTATLDGQIRVFAPS